MQWDHSFWAGYTLGLLMAIEGIFTAFTREIFATGIGWFSLADKPAVYWLILTIQASAACLIFYLAVTRFN